MPPRAKARSGSAKTGAVPVRPALSREFVAGHKRRRIMDAIAELTAEQGYDATKIGDIVRRAGVARKTLYDNFEGKEEVFLSAFDTAVDEALRADRSRLRRGRGRLGGAGPGRALPPSCATSPRTRPWRGCA